MVFSILLFCYGTHGSYQLHNAIPILFCSTHSSPNTIPFLFCGNHRSLMSFLHVTSTHTHTHTHTHTMLSLQTHQSLQSFWSCPQCIHDLKLCKLIIACTLSQNILSDGTSYLLEHGRSVQKLPILHSIFSNISAISNAHADKDPCEPL